MKEKWVSPDKCVRAPPAGWNTGKFCSYRGTSLIRNRKPPRTTMAPRHSSTIGSYGGAFSCERGTHVVTTWTDKSPPFYSGSQRVVFLSCRTSHSPVGKRNWSAKKHLPSGANLSKQPQNTACEAASRPIPTRCFCYPRSASRLQLDRGHSLETSAGHSLKHCVRQTSDHHLRGAQSKDTTCEAAGRGSAIVGPGVCQECGREWLTRQLVRRRENLERSHPELQRFRVILHDLLLKSTPHRYCPF